MKKLLILFLGAAVSGALAQSQSVASAAADPAGSAPRAVAAAAPQSTAQTTTNHKKPAEGSAQEERMEKSVQIVGEPSIGNVSATSATLTWQTNKNAATDVHYREEGTQHWKIAYERGGSKDHSVNLTGLKPGKKYVYQIRTREGKVRKEGNFQTPAQ